MSTSSQIESFFTTLFLGDFEENQNTAAQIVGGLISMVPVLDQVMDARDISGALFNINKHGGFKSASTDQLVNLGFAGFGAIPELGSAFKTVFKPLWKERRLAKGAVRGGLEAVERLLHLSKGGAIGWVRKELLGKWNARVQQVIAAVTAGLAAVIELTEFIATASGWRDWLIPDPVQALAKELLPSLKRMQGQINAPLQRASDEIRNFLEDLLGEQAAAVVMAVGQKAVIASVVPATRTKAGHNAADAHPKGKVPARQPEQKVQGTPKADAHKGQGPVHAVVQTTRKALSDLAAREKGLIGEHMVDYHELRRLGGNWPHDKPTGHWSPEDIKKINSDKRPVNLRLADLPRVTQPGLDAVWEHHKQYTVTEAKFSASVGVAYGMGKRRVSSGKLGKPVGLNPSLELLFYLLSDNTDKRNTGSPMVQMSKDWVEDRAKDEKIGAAAYSAIIAKRCDRRVVFVTFESSGSVDHGEALVDIHMGLPEDKVRPHTEHGISHEWSSSQIDAVVAAREKAFTAQQTTKAQSGESASEKPRPAKTKTKTKKSKSKT